MFLIKNYLRKYDKTNRNQHIKHTYKLIVLKNIDQRH